MKHLEQEMAMDGTDQVPLNLFYSGQRLRSFLGIRWTKVQQHRCKLVTLVTCIPFGMVRSRSKGNPHPWSVVLRSESPTRVIGRSHLAGAGILQPHHRIHSNINPSADWHLERPLCFRPIHTPFTLHSEIHPIRLDWWDRVLPISDTTSHWSCNSIGKTKRLQSSIQVDGQTDKNNSNIWKASDDVIRSQQHLKVEIFNLNFQVEFWKLTIYLEILFCDVEFILNLESLV